MKLERTFMHFLLDHQKRHNRTLNFVILMESIVTAAKYIHYYYHTGALQKNLGATSEINVHGESIMRMDMLAHNIVMHYLQQSEQVLEATSEELPEETILNEGGRYFVYFDPLDGSSNIKHSLPVGFLFGIAKRNLDAPEDYHLRAGREFIAAGMFVIPAGMFTFALHDSGVWNFVQDEAGIFIRPEPVHFPASTKNWELSFNTANLHTFAEPVQQWLGSRVPQHKFRYAGSLTVDMYRMLRNGGMFAYPAVVNHEDPARNMPDGKLRLLYEAAVVAFIAKEAGGLAISETGQDILDVVPNSRHQRTTLYTGNKELVSDLRSVLREEQAEPEQA